MNLEEKVQINQQKTINPRVPKQEERKWYFLDLKDQVPGRVATQITALLRGKREKYFLANFDLGNYVVMVNASKVKFTGDKLNDKYYYNHSGYPGKPRKRSTKEMLEKYPIELIRKIVWGMMPKNKLSRKQMTRLFVFADEKHDKQAQEKNFIKDWYIA